MWVWPSASLKPWPAPAEPAEFSPGSWAQWDVCQAAGGLAPIPHLTIYPTTSPPNPCLPICLCVLCPGRGCWLGLRPCAPFLGCLLPPTLQGLQSSSLGGLGLTEAGCS